MEWIDGSHFSKLQTRLEVEEGFSDDEAKMQSSKLWPLGKCWGWKHWNPYIWVAKTMVFNGFHGFQLRFCLNQCIATWLFGGIWWAPFFRQRWKTTQRRWVEKAHLKDLMGLSETGVPNGYFNGENDWKWWLPSGHQKPDMKSPCSKWRLEWNNPLELDRMSRLSIRRPWFSIKSGPYFQSHLLISLVPSNFQRWKSSTSRSPAQTEEARVRCCSKCHGT